MLADTETPKAGSLTPFRSELTLIAIDGLALSQSQKYLSSGIFHIRPVCGCSKIQGIFREVNKPRMYSVARTIWLPVNKAAFRSQTKNSVEGPTENHDFEIALFRDVQQ